MNSKFLTAVVVLTFVAMVATTVFQVIEMCDYKVFETLFK